MLYSLLISLLEDSSALIKYSISLLKGITKCSLIYVLVTTSYTNI